MQILADGALFLWPLAILMLFAALPPRSAMLTALIGGWLFLPVHEFQLPLIPDYSKMTATCFGVFAATLAFDPTRFVGLRFRWIDAPVILICIAPMLSSLTNDLGLYDGVSGVVSKVISVGMPYLLGRGYFRSVDDLSALAVAIVVGGLLYLPLCLYEMRMSPHLHVDIYGYRPGNRRNLVRFGGWRPVVFMKDGLQLSMWMVTSALTAFWLWWNQRLPQLLGLRPMFAAIGLVGVAILTRSTGAVLLLLMGMTVLVLTKWMGSKIALIALLLIPPVYIGVRLTGEYGWEPAVQAASWISEERAGSLQFRFEMEDILAERALERPLFGWGGWGRNRVHGEKGDDKSVTDGLWIIEFGTRGLFGLCSYFALLLLPLGLMVWKQPARVLSLPRTAPALVLATTVLLYAIDCLPNAMPNPVYFVMAGGILGTVVNKSFAHPPKTDGEPSVHFGRGNHTQSELLERKLTPGHSK
ncbi:O-antigen ligase family protein [Aeoliella sp. ICT_H6.2]|uniref:O-antigen ligase family protein n=1 Tax=Aeoliella straminimaris TaxID=2954799 RepID=A0A9X2FBU5_9BACT|nr:O-antigen ligase family protein [Aeoliella straminimaris]MCO6045363.1 O-antigen ligase family protein [Aeoliella straminimaris]